MALTATIYLHDKIEVIQIAETTTTVGDLKALLANKYPEFPLPCIALFYRGHIQGDSVTMDRFLPTPSFKAVILPIQHAHPEPELTKTTTAPDSLELK